MLVSINYYVKLNYLSLVKNRIVFNIKISKQY